MNACQLQLCYTLHVSDGRLVPSREQPLMMVAQTLQASCACSVAAAAILSASTGPI
jgi:hypothetical protein